MGVRRLRSEVEVPSSSTAGTSFSGEPSLKEGRGAMPEVRKPRAGMKPLGDGFMQMVPPVMIMRTRDSGTLWAEGEFGWEMPLSILMRYKNDSRQMLIKIVTLK